MLPKCYRLKQRRDFRRIYVRGSSKAYGGFVIYAKAGRQNTSKIGFSVSKKVGNAVTRNKLKRRFRNAAYQLIESFDPAKSYIFVIRTAAKDMSYADILRHMERALAAFKPKNSGEGGC